MMSDEWPLVSGFKTSTYVINVRLYVMSDE